jgi:proteasome lid subunit RPN8/RPN11
MEIHSENAVGKWASPECPFTIEYSPRVLDDIRLAVTDAFFSLPRGGAEIGGILLGVFRNGLLTIDESVSFNCEHAFGPSFVLSPRDFSTLEQLLATAKKNPNLRPVGWWHSHTRTEIFLSDADQEIHNRFFPEPWQVALVLKPHTFQPMRAGFFFREKDGSMHGAATYREFVLDPLPTRPLPSSSPAAPLISLTPGPREAAAARPTIDVNQVVEREPEPEFDEPELEERREVSPRRETPAPRFATEPPTRSRPWIAIAAVVLGLSVGIGVYESRARWMPQGLFRSSSPVPLALSLADNDGQLQIRWNGASEAAHGDSGTLVIADGPQRLIIALDSVHLRTGSFTYARTAERVDVTLTVPQPGAQPAVEATTFVGSSPQHRSTTGGDASSRVERDNLAAENEQLKANYAKLAERNKVLVKAVEELRKGLDRELQRKRLGLQSPDTAK